MNCSIRKHCRMNTVLKLHLQHESGIAMVLLTVLIPPTFFLVLYIVLMMMVTQSHSPQIDKITRSDGKRHQRYKTPTPTKALVHNTHRRPQSPHPMYIYKAPYSSTRRRRSCQHSLRSRHPRRTVSFRISPAAGTRLLSCPVQETPPRQSSGDCRVGCSSRRSRIT